MNGLNKMPFLDSTYGRVFLIGRVVLSWPRMCSAARSLLAGLVLGLCTISASGRDPAYCNHSGPGPSPENPLDLLQRVAENYHNLRSFEFTGQLTTTIPGTEMQMHVATADAEAGRSFVPANSPVLKYGEAISFRDSKITDAQGGPPGSDFSGASISMPMHWGHYDEIATGIKDVRALPSEVIKVDGTPVECTHLEVVYDKERWHPEEFTVRYWIDPKRLLVLKEDFAEVQGRREKSALWYWVYQVDSVKLNQPPPKWLVEVSTTHGDHARPEWVGRSAPDFSLPDLDGHRVNLSTMKGKVVVLDFWATWCGPCREELPTVEKIASDYSARGVEVWGISEDEEPSTVKKWLTSMQRKMQTVIDTEGKTEEQYQLEGIPTLIVLGRDGNILSYYTGNQPEQSLRSAIDMALRERRNR
jgi:peroxiredoxin